MNFILPIWARALFMAALVAAGGFIGWHVNGWRLGTEIADLKTQHAQAIADATAKTLAAQRKADADHAALASQLAQSESRYHEDLTRAEHENDSLRAAVASGSRVVRVHATCPAVSGDVSKAAAGSGVDPGASAVLAAADGQVVLDLRARIIETEHKLAAAQQALMCITGQGACPK